jgi:hypothetical protein
MSQRTQKSVLDFARDDLSPLVEALHELETERGWINITPGIPAEAVEDDRSLFSWLTGARPQIAPLATWMPPEPGSTKPGVLGILHAGGRLTREELAMLDLPGSWRSRQNHARRGLLYELGSWSPEEMATMMTRVVDRLAAMETTGRYLAEVFRRR